MLKDGILLNVYQELKQHKKVEAKFIELYPEIMVIANIVFDFEPIEERIEEYLPRDAYPEFFNDNERDYMG